MRRVNENKSGKYIHIERKKERKKERKQRDKENLKKKI
jgi:hypothetical protein